MSISSTPYITSWNDIGWLVRVPVSYFYHENSKTLRYKQRLFNHAKHGGSVRAMTEAVAWRDLNRIPDLIYNGRGPEAGNGKQVSHKKRTRGSDLPVGITDTLRHSRQGKEQYSIDVQVMYGKVSKTKSFMYGHSRTREEAVTKAKEILEKFLSEIE